jgi:methionine synthase I (cobalamin-dependent)
MKIKQSLLERLHAGIVIGAEGYLFEMERRGYIKAGAYVPEVVLDYPDALRQLHREFLRAGSDIMLAFTYYGHREKMKHIGREKDLEKLNHQAILIAKEIASDGNALVAGNISNTWVYDPNQHAETAPLAYNIFEEQVRWAIDHGVDFVIAETIDSLGEAREALKAIKKFDLPAVVMMASIDDLTRDGYTYAQACRHLEQDGADVVGLNCTRGPDTMLPIIEQIRDAVKGYVAAVPVTYRTTSEQPIFQTLKEPGKERAFPIELDPFEHTRSEMAEFARRCLSIGVNYIGTCCGAGPHHVRAMAEALGRTVPASRFSPDLSQHAMLGKKVLKHNQPFLSHWKDGE